MLEKCESIRKRKIGHVLQHYSFRRGLIALRFRCLIYVPLRHSELRSSSRARSALCKLVCREPHFAFAKLTPCNRFHVLSVEALANRRHLRGVFCLARCRGVMSGSESVPPRKALKRCMLFRQFCEAHMHRNSAKQSPLTKAYVVWQHDQSFFSWMQCIIS